MSNQQPIVNGVRPLFGPYETEVEIRGSNLGYAKEDLLSVKLCGVECIAHAKWLTQTRIKCRNLVVTAEEVTGGIIVSTKSGGEGKCDGITFTAHPPKDGSGLQSKYWEDDDKFVIRFGRTKEAVVETALTAKERDLLCFHDDLNMIERSSVNQLQKLLPNSTKHSGDVKSEDFDPLFYILQNHSRTSLEQLKQGQTLLNGLIDKQQQGPVEHLKKNISQIVECNDIVQSLSRPIKEDPLMNADHISRLCDKLAVLNEQTQNMFSGALQRKDESDSTRNALNVLGRFSFIFNLPKSIGDNLNLGKYDIIIKDYELGRTLMENQNQNHPVFLNVQQQIHDQIAKVKETLFQLLLDVPQPVEEQTRIVGYLVNLGLSESEDPAWDTIEKMRDYIEDIMYQCREAYKEYQSNSSGTQYVIKEPVKIVFIKEFTQLFRDHLTLFCKMGRAYGVYSRGDPTAQSQSDQTRVQYYAQGFEPRFYLNHCQRNFAEFDSMCSNLTNTFIGFVFKAFTPADPCGGDWAEDAENDSSNELLMCYLSELCNLLLFFSKSPEAEKIKSALASKITTMQICCLENVLINSLEELNKLEENWQFSVTDSGFESQDLEKVLQTMKKYLGLMSDISKSSAVEISSLWSSNPEKKADLTDSVYDFFTLVLKKYHELAMQLLTLSNEDYTEAPNVWLKLVKSSNITSVSCFSTLDQQSALVILLRNITILKNFVCQQLKNKRNAYLPLITLSPKVTACAETVLTSTSELFDDLVKSQLIQIIAKSQNASQADKNVRAASMRFPNQSKVSRCGHLIMNHLVKVFNTIQTIDPSSLQTLFPSVLKSITCLIADYKKAQLVSFTDVNLIVRLLDSRMSSEDRKAFKMLLNSFSISQREQEKSAMESDAFLNQNRFHFICFSS